MAPNPHSPPSFGVNPPAIEGRQQYVNDFAYALDQGAGAAGRTTLVTGQRGVGKSVMLNVYHQVAASRQWISVHEDASAGFAHRLTVTRLPEVFERLDDASARKQRITGGSLSVLGFGGSLQTDQENTNPIEPDFRHQLMRTLEVLQAHGTGLLITLNEVHRSNLAELQDITDGISYAVRAHAPVAFVGAGLPETINSLVNSDVSTYLRRATRVELGNLTGDETRSALKLPAEEAGKTFTAMHWTRPSQLPETIHTWSSSLATRLGGHPPRTRISL
ncbi:ATP-binding protein [Brevibacterium sp. 50QC2O2]|uniref:ATP-binding protein n=1 Tax=Brevibacterium sp. 50QC2O2 TaxID=2968459 RepID=UPI00211C30A8|nr:ATP-binding protein [Brevibacterium sp. 50QC2O2]MCQ9388174.1 ATP-binding protein [Brevibacterium sp. 50QC2O2]